MGEVVRLPTLNIDICLKDGRPCHVGVNTDDDHWRCGTSACREPDRLALSGGSDAKAD